MSRFMEVMLVDSELQVQLEELEGKAASMTIDLGTTACQQQRLGGTFAAGCS
jgi:hypothetical protein